jgi:hypothetical protein
MGIEVAQMDVAGRLNVAIKRIERLRIAILEACDLLAERTQGSAARSPGHNARVRLEAALEVGATNCPVSTE